MMKYRTSLTHPCLLLVSLTVSLGLSGIQPATGQLPAGASTPASSKIRVLIVDGANNHDWRATTDSVRATLNSTGLFSVDVSTAPHSTMYAAARDPRDADDAVREALKDFVSNHQTPTRKELEKNLSQQWEQWDPDFSAYDTVLLNYNGRNWSEPMRRSFIKYVHDGGGLVLIHATNNGFRDWDEFNQMIGLGYNGNRGTEQGACTKIDPDTGQTYRCCVGQNSGHGSRHPFVIQVREPDHPIMRDIPLAWRHGTDELYHNLRGPARNMTILSSAYSDPAQRGTGHHEPITMTVRYGKGRVVQTTMGHFWKGQTDWDALYCVGFQTLIARSCQFTATGEVTLDVPESFPRDGNTSIQPPHQVRWTVEGKPTRTASADQTSWREKLAANPYTILSPAEQRESFQLADGFVIEAVASEPMVEEPVLAVWDANGAMYVAEMRSYMQDEVGTGTKTLNNGRVKKLVDTDGDGVMDHATVFVDNLNLPRMILPLDERIAIVETDATTVFAYTDTDNDGVADKKEILFEGRVSKDRSKSVEHQDSGLVWNIDNWIYLSYNRERYRFTDGTWKAEPAMGHWAQWGLSRDDTGNLFYSSNEQPIVAQVPQKYWGHIKRATGSDPRFVPTVGFPFDPEFLTSKSLCPVGDKGPGQSEAPKFTSLCGQEIFRGNALPRDVYGNLFFVDPTIHVVRRSLVENVNGKITLRKANGADEFLLSPDFNFRPVNTHTGPDGCLYVVDMYRGIIQDAGWFNENSQQYARDKGFNQHVQRGRIWRIRHKDHHPRRVPRMLEEHPLALLRHFDSGNGWIRDTAQKLIVLRGNDASVSSESRDRLIAALEAIVRFNPHRPLAKLHALWTLEGLDEIDQSLVELALRDRDSRVQSAAIQIGERFIQDESEAFYDALDAAAERCDSEVAKQLVMSLGWSQSERATGLIERVARDHIAHDGVYLATMASQWGRETELIKSVRDGSVFESVRDEERRNQLVARWNEGLAAWDYRRPRFPDDWTSKQRWLAGGEGIFFQACSRCHGPNGEGQKLPGHTLLIAPPLAGSPRVTGDPELMIRILLHGLTGPVNGQTYGAGLMPRIAALGHTDPNRITQVANFVRYAWGNNQTPVDVELVKKIIDKTKNRKRPFTLEELGVDTGGLANKALEEELLAADRDTLAAEAISQGNALRGRGIFYSPVVACFSCHDPPVGASRMGPDLSNLNKKPTAAGLIDSILYPSRKIDKQYAQTVVLRSDGRIVTGLRVSENDDEIVLRNTADGTLNRIPQDEIDEIVDSDVSLMPRGQVTQLKDRGQFLDLVKFLIKLNQ